LAYHGCDEKVGKAILAGAEEIKASANPYDWLGAGAYFWENSYSRALQWAGDRKGQGGSTLVKNPFVIGAIIDPGNCLDLADEGSLSILRATFPALEQLMELAQMPMPVNEAAFPGDSDLLKRHRDCATINLLHRLRHVEGKPPFDSVRCPFFEGGPLYDGSGIQSKTHLQWCVRDPAKSVIGYFRPRPPR
jgi:hypothetical protein